jgi:tetratricopeptide (TPR) repeat protein
MMLKRFLPLSALLLLGAAPRDINAPFARTPAEMLAWASGAPEPASEAAEYLLDATDVRIDRDGRTHRTDRVVYRVIDVARLPSWMKEIHCNHGWLSSKPEVRARVVTPDGQEHWLDRGLLSDERAREEADTYSDSRVLRGPLPAIAGGAVVEVEVTQEFSAWGKSGDHLRFPLLNALPTRSLSVRVRAPLDRPFHVTETGAQWPYRIVEEGSKHILTLEAASPPALEKDEAGSPEDFPSVPYLWVSTMPDWRAAAREEAAIVDGVLAGARLEQLARQVVGETRDAREAANRILKWMAPLRYASVDYAETSVVPRAPAEVLRRQFGDCKDLATLVIGLLRAAGFEAWPVLLLTAGQDNIDEAPGLRFFDHAIVRVGGLEPFWLDATQFAELPAGSLPMMDQGRRVLVASPETARLERLPVAPPDVNRNRTEIRLEYSASGPGRVRETQDLEGAFAGRFRPMGPKALADGREVAEKWVKRVWEAERLERYEVNPGQLTDPARRTIEAAGTRKVWTGLERASFTPAVERVLSELPGVLIERYDPKSTQPRKAPLAVRPQLTEVVYTLVPARGFVARPRPSAERVVLGAGVFTREDSILADGSVRVALAFRLAANRMTADDVNAFRKALADFRARRVSPVVFDAEVTSALSSGDFRRAMDRSRALIQAEPGSAMHHVRVARVLLQAGLGPEARRAAQRAVELAPESADAWEQLGQVLSHDLRGVEHGPGWDRDGAVAAFRKALALHEEGTTLARLALTLEHAPDGERYGDGSRLDEALEVYQRYRTLESAHDLEVLEAYAALQAGRCERARERLQWVQDSMTREAISLACHALEHGSEAAVGLSETIEGGPSDRARALAGSARVLTAMRRYEVARVLLTAAVSASPGDGYDLFDRALRSARRTEQRDGERPEDAVRRALVESLARPSTRADRIPGLDDFRKAHQGLFSELQSSVDSRRVAVELLVGALDVTITRQTAQSWEVRSTAAWPGAQTWRWQLRRQDGSVSGLARLQSRAAPFLGAARARSAAEDARHARKLGRPRALLEDLASRLEASPEDLQELVLDALATGDASDKVLAQATSAVLATGRDDPDALRVLELVRLARGELGRARTLELEALKLDPWRRPDRLARQVARLTRRALGLMPTTALGEGTWSTSAGSGGWRDLLGSSPLQSPGSDPASETPTPGMSQESVGLSLAAEGTP